MSKFPFVITLLISAALVGWLHVSADGKSSGGSGSAPASSGRRPKIHGFPDPEGIVLQLSRMPANACAAARFRSDSPEFVLWDDGTVVYRNSTLDYRKGRFPMSKAQDWLSRLRHTYPRKGTAGCDAFWVPTEGDDWTDVSARDASGPIAISVYGLEQCAGAHADRCDACRELRPFASLVRSIASYRSDRDEALAALPVEVFLQFKSCGCRNHPEIVNVSREWGLPGEGPARRCGRGTARMVVEDPEQIRWLAGALERSSAVLDQGEIYTCFTRPLLKFREPATLAKK